MPDADDGVSTRSKQGQKPRASGPIIVVYMQAPLHLSSGWFADARCIVSTFVAFQGASAGVCDATQRSGESESAHS